MGRIIARGRAQASRSRSLPTHANRLFVEWSPTLNKQCVGNTVIRMALPQYADNYVKNLEMDLGEGPFLCLRRSRYRLSN
jgi:hypothetical protein